MRRAWALCLAGLQVGCGAGGRPNAAALGAPVPCPSYAPGRPRPVEELERLQGDYDLFYVVANQGTPPNGAHGRLTLRRPEGTSPEATLLGRMQLDSVAAMPPPRPDSVTLVGHTLVVGRGVDDPSAMRLTIRALTSDGFWGYWQLDLSGEAVVLTDSAGRPVPDPVGHFCAVRR
jgi:hypothetical protein